MRIAMIGFRGIPHTYGGGEELVRHLAPGLVQKGHHVIVYCRTYLFSNRDRYFNGVERVFLPTIEHKFLGQFIHATLCVLDVLFRKVDLIYIHTLPSGVHSIVPWLFRRTIVVNPNGFDWKRAKWGFVGKAYFKLSALTVLITARKLITDSKTIRNFYLERFKRDSTYVAYGANIESSKNPELLGKHRLKPHDYYLVACRLVPENNIDMIIAAFIRSSTSRRLVIAGSANFRNEWIRKLYAVKDSRVVFLGHISDPEEMKELHCHCYAYIHGHSLGGTNPALVKALGYGNCVLAYNTPFNKEVLLKNDGTMCGLLFDSIDGLHRMLDDVDQNEAVVQGFRLLAPQRVMEAFTWDKIIADYEGVFKAALT